MRAVFYHLMKSSEAYKQLQLELDSAAARGELSSPVKYSEAIKLPLLCACIKEAMRLHPSVGLTLPRLAPPGGLNLSAGYIPEGYCVGVNAAVVQRDPRIFGSKPDEFRPSRWLEGDGKNMDRYMLHFGGGTRTCLGKNVSDRWSRQTLPNAANSQISLSELHKLIPQILRHFDLELADPTTEWETTNLWFNKQTGIHVRVNTR
jgi:cytochrome P450